MSFRGVFFDLYGTLLVYGDVQAAWRDWLSALYDRLALCGLAMSKKALAERCDGFFRRPAPPRREDGLTVYERRIQALGAGLGLNLSDLEIQKTADATIAAWHQHVSLDPQARDVLSVLRSARSVGLITNYDHPPHIYLLLARLRLAASFDVVVISGEVGVEKPDPRIFELALRPTGLEPREAIYVGDTVEDVQGALAAGLCPILIRRGELEGEVADFRLDGQSSEVEPIQGVETISSLAALIDMLGPESARRCGKEE